MRIEVVGLRKEFSGSVAVRDVSFTIEQPAFIGVIGRSGAGKSTLLRMMNRLIDPTAGSIVCDGVDVTKLAGRKLLDWRADCAMVFQQFNLVGRLDVMTNVLMGRLNKVSSARSLFGLWSRSDRAIALTALEMFDIGQLAAQRADSLSGGQQQRVAIARALVQEPRVILADEPIASLDPRNTKLVMDALMRIHREHGITVICNLHSLELARGYCERLIGMAAGGLVFDGTPDRLTNDVARQLYGLEAGDVMELDAPRTDAPFSLPQPERVSAA